MDETWDILLRPQNIAYDESREKMQKIMNSLQVAQAKRINDRIEIHEKSFSLSKDLNSNHMEDSINSPYIQKEILNLIEKIYFHSKSSINDDEQDYVDPGNQPSVVEYELKVIFTCLWRMILSLMYN